MLYDVNPYFNSTKKELTKEEETIKKLEKRK